LVEEVSAGSRERTFIGIPSIPERRLWVIIRTPRVPLGENRFEARSGATGLIYLLLLAIEGP